MAGNDRLGGKLGPRIARLTADAIVDTQRRLADHKIAVTRDGINEALAVWGAEITAHTGDTLRGLADHEGTPEWVGRLLHFVARGQGQAAGILATTTIGGLTNALGALVNNALSPATQQAIREMGPSLPLDPGTAAQTVARHLQDYDVGAREAAGQGIDGPRFSALVNLAAQWPDAGAVLQLLNRGQLDVDMAAQILGRLGFTPQGAGLLLELRHQLPAGPDLALGVLRGNIDPGRAADLAAEQGIGAEDFDLMIGNTGEPPGTQELLEAFRRGLIDQGRLVRGIRQSRVRNEWVDVIEGLRFAPPPVGTVVSAVVENQLPDAKARQLVEEAGLDPAHFDWVVATHGRPPGTEQMLELLNRGVVTEAEVRQSIRESDVKNKYVDHILAMRYRLPPERTVVSMLRHGVITRARGTELLHKLGFFPEDAQALLDEASADKTASSRDLSTAQFGELYRLGALSRADLHGQLVKAGYDTAEADRLIELEDLKTTAALRAQATSVVRSRYVGRRLDRAEASGALDTLGVPHDQRDRLLETWDLELAASTRTLTEAQVAQALKKQLIDTAEAGARWAAMGYDDDDVLILFGLAGFPGGQ